jgi:hypothetical protein
MGFQPTVISAAPAASANGYVVSVAMKVGAYTLAVTKPTFGARHVTLARTFVSTGDTPGTVVVVGTDPSGQTITETMTPGASGVTVTSTAFFASVASITGVGWVSVAGDDTIVFGWDAQNAVAVGPGGTLHAITVNATAAGAITVTDATGQLLQLKTSIAEGQYLYDINWSGFMRVEPAAASNITVAHTGSTPSTFAM